MRPPRRYTRSRMRAATAAPDSSDLTSESRSSRSDRTAAATDAPAEVPTTMSASLGCQPVANSMAISVASSYAAPVIPPPPSTRPILRTLEAARIGPPLSRQTSAIFHSGPSGRQRKQPATLRVARVATLLPIQWGPVGLSVWEADEWTRLAGEHFVLSGVVTSVSPD